MDDFSAILKEISESHQRATGERKPEQYECPKCKDTGYVFQRDEKGNEIACRCECIAIKQAKDIIKRSGISTEFQKKNFEDFLTKGDLRLINARTKAMQYVQHFVKTEHARYNSIMFYGQVGAGKTHLGMAICSELMKCKVPVIYMAYRNAVTRIKQNIIDEKIYHQELNQYTLARVLFIDDLLKGRLTETDINILYDIVNYRYMNNMPIIISTEKEPRELLEFDEAIGSRLIEMCRGNIIQLQGKDLNYRLS